MNRLRWTVALVASVAFIAVSCGDDNGSSSSGSSSSGNVVTKQVDSIGKGEGAVSIVAWAGYIERGENDPAYDWVTKFEQDTGCKVSVKTAGTSDEMVTLMTGSKDFDLVTASGDASLRLIRGGTVQPTNDKLIDGLSTIDSRLKDGAWYTVDGRHYGVPYQWGPNVLLYNTTTFPQAPTSWDVVLTPKTLPDGKPNEGRVQSYDGPIAIADGALYLKKHEPSLGIEDPYALSQKQFDATIDLLKKQRPLVNQYWHDTTKQVDAFKNEGTVAASSWPYQVNTLKADNGTFASTIPEEGATGWADTTMLATNAPHPNCAYMWLNHSITKDTQAAVASWFGSVPAVPSACEGSDLLGPDGCKTNGIDDFDKISFWKTPQADCFGKGDKKCVPYSEWTTAYQGVMSS
jgi:putative spermidine/putrescine transport system substrate-binding protein